MPGTILAALLHDLLKADSFETFSDLKDALKSRAARLRIPYDATAVTAAIRSVERSRPVLAGRGGR